MLRFSGAALALIGVGVGARLWLALRTTGAGRGLVVALPLPWFDDELDAATLASVRSLRPVRAAMVAALAVAVLGACAFVAGTTDVRRGVVDVRIGQTVEAWQPAGAGAKRQLPLALSVEAVSAGPAARVSTAPLSSRDATSRELAPLETVKIGRLSAAWTAMTRSRDAGVVVLNVTDRDGGASETVRVPVGGSRAVSGLEGVSLSVTDRDDDRMGSLGRAVWVELNCGESVEAFWLHDIAPGFQAAHGGGCAAVELVGYAPASSLRFSVAEVPSVVLLLVAGVSVLIALVAFMFSVRRRVFLRGRSGDYELVALDGLFGTRRALASVGEALLVEPDAIAGWRRLLDRFGAGGGR